MSELYLPVAAAIAPAIAAAVWRLVGRAATRRWAKTLEAARPFVAAADLFDNWRMRGRRRQLAIAMQAARQYVVGHQVLGLVVDDFDEIREVVVSRKVDAGSPQVAERSESGELRVAVRNLSLDEARAVVKTVVSRTLYCDAVARAIEDDPVSAEAWPLVLVTELSRLPEAEIALGRTWKADFRRQVRARARTAADRILATIDRHMRVAQPPREAVDASARLAIRRAVAAAGRSAD